MRKCKKLALNRETLRHLNTLRQAVGGATAATACNQATCALHASCMDTCPKFCKGTTVC